MTSKNVIIVSTSDYSFQKASKEHYYAFPESQNKKAKKYIAFYRTKPIKSITHYAKILDVDTVPLEKFTVKDMLMMFGHNPEKNIIKFNLGNLIPLKKPVKAKVRGIQGYKYTHLSTLKSSGYVEQI